MSVEKKQLTCMDLHPGDFILVESFEFQSSFIDKIKTLSDTTVTTESGNKLSYYAITGIPLKQLGQLGLTKSNKWLEQLDFLVGDLGTLYSPAPVYYKDNLAIDVESSTILVKGTLKTRRRLKYLHEVQHWYYDVTGKRLRLNIKDKNKS